MWVTAFSSILANNLHPEQIKDDFINLHQHILHMCAAQIHVAHHYSVVC